MLEKIEYLEGLKKEIKNYTGSRRIVAAYYLGMGYTEHFDDPSVIARAYAFSKLMLDSRKFIYDHDLIIGSFSGACEDADVISDAEFNYANSMYCSHGIRGFWTNSDHFAPDYETFVNDGVPGTIAKIDASLEKYKDDRKKVEFLTACRICMESFSEMIGQYAEAALRKGNEIGSPDIIKASEVLNNLRVRKPETFREALQLMWLVHLSTCYEGRYAMALGRIDQFLYPFYERDVKNGTLTYDEAKRLLACTFIKIGERFWFGGDDVVNIAIGGLKKDGTGGVNELSYAVLDAVGTCYIPGPNLSARLYEGVPDEFVDACLKVIGTGLGYPALMNDRANIPAMKCRGYSDEDANNYCMVGCIENFMQGAQPPWSDGRYNTPKYLELALNNGIDMLSGNRRGPKTGDPADFRSMDDLMNALETQMRYGAAEYVFVFKNENERYNAERYQAPFLSCFCRDCIGRGLDINNGGALYPSVHGAGVMGIGTMADSLAAVEKVVFTDRFTDMKTLREALLTDFKGYERLQAELLAAPKYGNNDPLPDKYAQWFVRFQNEIFSKYRTYDGGHFYIGIASNVSNIPAGLEVAATPDGRNARAPMSDAASPTFGRDTNGPTAAVLSLSKPDYRVVSLGSVINQKYSPSAFRNDEKRAKLAALIKMYFSRGGQEIQVNSVSRDVLSDAIEHPENYTDLVVRVSGFSAYYNNLSIEVKKDILSRTEHA